MISLLVHMKHTTDINTAINKKLLKSSLKNILLLQTIDSKKREQRISQALEQQIVPPVFVS